MGKKKELRAEIERLNQLIMEERVFHAQELDGAREISLKHGEENARMTAEIERFKAARDKREKTLGQWSIRIVELEFQLEEMLKKNEIIYSLKTRIDDLERRVSTITRNGIKLLNLFKVADAIFKPMPADGTHRVRWEAAKKQYGRA